MKGVESVSQIQPVKDYCIKWLVKLTESQEDNIIQARAIK
jgi:hypothetical protein